MGSMADILDTQGSPVALPTYSMATTPGPMPTAAINGTVMGTSVMLPSAAQSDSVFLRPRPAGPAAPPAVPASAPAAVAAQRSPFVGLASYIEDAPPAPLREDAYSSTGIAVAPWCEPDSGELLLLSPAKDTLADGRPITFVRRTSERIPDDKRQGWIFESALQKPVSCSIEGSVPLRTDLLPL